MPLPPTSTQSVAPYYAPDFFSPFYFTPLPRTTIPPPTGPVQFFAPSYFSPYYFPPLVVDQPPVDDPTADYNDRDAFAAMTAALTELGEFADVVFGTTADRRPAGADIAPVAVITPVGWEEVDEVDAVELVRTVAFELTVITRGEDAAERFRQLGRLSALAQNAIDGTDLGGGCLPALTMLRRGTYERNPVLPEQRAVLHGEFTYLIRTFQDHSDAR